MKQETTVECSNGSVDLHEDVEDVTVLDSGVLRVICPERVTVYNRESWLTATSQLVK